MRDLFSYLASNWQLVQENEVVEEFDDCLGNMERRCIDFVDIQAPCMRTIYVGVIDNAISTFCIYILAIIGTIFQSSFFYYYLIFLAFCV